MPELAAATSCPHPRSLRGKNRSRTDSETWIRKWDLGNLAGLIWKLGILIRKLAGNMADAVGWFDVGFFPDPMSPTLVSATPSWRAQRWRGTAGPWDRASALPGMKGKPTPSLLRSKKLKKPSIITQGVGNAWLRSGWRAESARSQNWDPWELRYAWGRKRVPDS